MGRASGDQVRQAEAVTKHPKAVQSFFGSMARAGCLALLATGLFVSGARADCLLRVGWEPYAIYTYEGADGTLTGADIELMRALAEDIGCQIRFSKLPWARVLLELKNGQLDAATSASETPERAAYAYFSDVYRDAEMALYVRRGEAKSYKLDSLAAIPAAGIRVGVIAGYHYGVEFAQLMQQQAFAAQVDPALDYRTNINKLLGGRIDVYLVEDVGVMVAEAKALGVEGQIERHPLRLPGEPLHLMFSRQSVEQETVQAVNAGLARMRAEGRLQAIMDKFLN